MDLPSDLDSYARDSWNKMASHWIKIAGKDGNDFHRKLVSPTAEKLLEVRPGQDEILEVACGAGIFAKRLHDLGAKRVVATDFSEEFLSATKCRCEGLDNMEFYLLDATNKEQIVTCFDLSKFDKVICNMGLMDMTDIDPLFAGIFQILKPGGSFVFTVMHPCFNGYSLCKGVEETEDPSTGQSTQVNFLKQTAYLQWKPSWGRGLADQPVNQLYFHRPLHELFRVIITNGFVVDGLEEPAFVAEELVTEETEKVSLMWSKFIQFPPVLGIRCRKIR